MSALVYYSLVTFIVACCGSLIGSLLRYRATRRSTAAMNRTIEEGPAAPRATQSMAELSAHDVVLLDARPWVRDAWTHDAQKCGKLCHCFSSADAMREALPAIGVVDPPIFIGKTYDADEDSHALAQSLYVQGYHQLTLLL